MLNETNYTFAKDVTKDDWRALPRSFAKGEEVHRFTGYTYGLDHSSEEAVSDIAKLRERVQKATGPDRELDLELLRLIEPEHVVFRPLSDKYTASFASGRHYWVYNVVSEDGGYSSSVPILKITASIDAALALVERCLPGFRAGIRTGDPSFESTSMRLPSATLTAFNKNDAGWKLGKPKTEHAATPALAVAAALLAALEAAHEQG